MWIDDVIPGAVIRSAAWGNTVRDRIVQTYATRAERDAHPLPDGSLCTTAEDRRLWQYRGDLARWIIVNEPWQDYAARVDVASTSGIPGATVDIARSRMTGDWVTLRIVATAPTSLGAMYVTLPPTRTNAGPEGAVVAGLLAGTDYKTGLTTGLAPIVEYGRFYGRNMASWAAVGPTGLGYTYAGTFSYQANSYGP